MMILKMKYAACYCEENVWHLCADSALAGMEKRVVWVSSLQQICPLWCQQAAPTADEPVWWDYHVFLLAQERGERWTVWDLDSTLGVPVNASEYVRQTFRQPMPLQPIFRVMDATYYLDTFSSDRSHMRGAGGELLAAPPQWPAIVPSVVPVGADSGLTFAEMLDMQSSKHGELVGLDELIQLLSG